MENHLGKRCGRAHRLNMHGSPVTGRSTLGLAFTGKVYVSAPPKCVWEGSWRYSADSPKLETAHMAFSRRLDKL